MAVECCRGLTSLLHSNTAMTTHSTPPTTRPTPTPTSETDVHSPLFNLKLVRVVASISEAQRQVLGLAGILGVEETVQQLLQGKRITAAEQVKVTVMTLTASVSSNIDTLLDGTIESAVDKVRERLREGVERACEEGREGYLLDHMLTPTLTLIHHHLPSPLQQRLLQRLWEAVLAAFMLTVSGKAQRTTPDYFECVYQMLQSTFRVFTTPGSLPPSSATTPGYRSLVEDLDERRVSSHQLILQYYQEHLTHLTHHTTPTTAHLLLRTFYSQPGSLRVRVLEVRDICWSEATGSSCQRSGQQARYCVEVQLVPRHMFPSASVCTTSKQRPPASFYDTFQFPTGVIGGGSPGWLQLTLQVVRVSGGSTYLGEGLLPLSTLPYLGSPEVHNTCLRMTAPLVRPGESGYKCVSVLRSRLQDPLAVSFTKCLRSYHPETARNDRI
nr:uncharacterized protein LOC128693703 [Cherax quadricarinatus]